MDKRWPPLALMAGSALLAAGCGAAPAAAPAQQPPTQSPSSQQPPSASSSPAGSASSASSSVSATVAPSLALTMVGWDYTLDSPALWVQATNNLSSPVATLRVKATFVNPATNEVLGTDTEYLAGSDIGGGSGTLQPGQSSVPVEVSLLGTSSLGPPVPVTAAVQWSWHNFGGWHTWKTVSIPGGPPPGPFTNGQVSALPTPAQNVLNFVPGSAVSSIAADVMLVTGHNHHLAGSTFVGTVAEAASSNGNVDVTWSVPLGAAASGSSVFTGNPVVFQFSITSGGSTLQSLNANAQNLVYAAGG